VALAVCIGAGTAGINLNGYPMEEPMFKRVLITAAMTALIAIALPAEASAAQAGTSCRDAAKLQYPNDRQRRAAFRRECKKAYKARASAASS
jgi:hypothetical protein